MSFLNKAIRALTGFDVSIFIKCIKTGQIWLAVAQLLNISTYFYLGKIRSIYGVNSYENLIKQARLSVLASLGLFLFHYSVYILEMYFGYKNGYRNFVRLFAWMFFYQVVITCIVLLQGSRVCEKTVWLSFVAETVDTICKSISVPALIFTAVQYDITKNYLSENEFVISVYTEFWWVFSPIRYLFFAAIFVSIWTSYYVSTHPHRCPIFIRVLVFGSSMAFTDR